MNTGVKDAVLSNELLGNYFERLVNKFFKILPMRENAEESLSVYVQSLLAELLGAGNLIPNMKNDADYLTILAVLQYLTDHPKCKVSDVKREVFGAISVCNKLRLRYVSEVDRR